MGSLRCAHSSLNESVCQKWVFTMHGRTLPLFRTSRVFKQFSFFGRFLWKKPQWRTGGKLLVNTFGVAFSASSTSLVPPEVHSGFNQIGVKSRWGVNVSACMSEVGGWPGVGGCLGGVFAECSPLLASYYVSTTILLNPASSTPFMCNSSCK